MVRLVATLLLALFLVPLPSVVADNAPMALFAPTQNDASAIRQTLELPGATWYNDKNGDKIFDSLLERFALDGAGPQRVIVTFRDGADVDAAMQQVASVAGSFTPRYVYHHVGGFAADLDLTQVAAVARLDAVRQVEWSQPGELELNTATVNFNVDVVQDQLGINGDQDMLEDITGNDTVIAIMDTGFDGEHVDLQGKFLRFIDWGQGGEEMEPHDTGSHGTHVASIAGGLGIGDPQYTGVAPGAAFVGFQITGGDTKANAIASMDWMIGHQEEVAVRISTISFGFGTTTDGTDALELAMDRAWEAGIVPFKSLGNSGPEKGTVTIPGGARGIIGTGSLHDAGDGGFRISSFSSRGPTADGRTKPDITAPGSNIMAASAGSTDGYVSLSGTSMASPFAAGVAALMISADPSISNDDVRRIMQDTSWDWGAPGHDDDWGAGRIDALRAVQQVLLEKAIRERTPFDEVQAWDVAPAGQAWHARGSLDGDVETVSFTVESADVALGVTVLADGLESTAGPVRALQVQLISPSGEGQTFIASTGAVSRQHTFAVNDPEPGLWTLRAAGFDGMQQIHYDAVGMVPANEFTPVLPVDGPAYFAMLGDEEVTTPAPAMLLLLAAIAVLRRRN